MIESDDDGESRFHLLPPFCTVDVDADAAGLRGWVQAAITVDSLSRKWPNQEGNKTWSHVRRAALRPPARSPTPPRRRAPSSRHTTPRQMFGIWRTKTAASRKQPPGRRGEVPRGGGLADAIAEAPNRLATRRSSGPIELEAAVELGDVATVDGAKIDTRGVSEFSLQLHVVKPFGKRERPFPDMSGAPLQVSGISATFATARALVFLLMSAGALGLFAALAASVYAADPSRRCEEQLWLILLLPALAFGFNRPLRNIRLAWMYGSEGPIELWPLRVYNLLVFTETVRVICAPAEGRARPRRSHPPLLSPASLFRRRRSPSCAPSS